MLRCQDTPLLGMGNVTIAEARRQETAAAPATRESSTISAGPPGCELRDERLMARYFSPSEIRGLDPELVAMLDEAREIARVPFVITSGYRKGDRKAHGKRKAVDLGCSLRASVKRMKMVNALMAVGFVRIGIYNKHVHADVATKAEGFPQRVLWWGTSK